MSRSDPGARRTRQATRSGPGSVAGAAASIAVAMLLGSGCVENALREAQRPFDYEPVTPAPKPGPTEGAIWPGAFASGSFLSFDRKARNVGDLLTVRVVEQVEARNEAATGLESEGDLSAILRSDIGLQGLIAKPVGELLGRLVKADRRSVDAGEDLTIAQGSSTNDFDGSGKTERSGSFEAVITTRVVAVLPGDVLHIRGRRSITVNHELQYMTLEALVRRADISIENVVPSTVLAEARITLDGIGVIDDKQRPGWLLRAMSWISPL
ncbi:MAG: flagellar basal body L-ring protein FlgH [Myxococcota bacterium]|nr:flagellar basal body L-ring protein FlgH [Myxococcota bacterium]